MKKSKCLKPPRNKVKDRQKDTVEWVVSKGGEVFKSTRNKYASSYIGIGRIIDRQTVRFISKDLEPKKFCHISSKEC